MELHLMAAFTVIYHDEVDASADAYWERTGISQSYDHLLLRASPQTDSGTGGTELRMSLNGATAYADYVDYSSHYLHANGATVQAGRYSTATGSPSFSLGHTTDTGETPANTFSDIELWFPNYTNTTNWTVGINTTMREQNLSIKMGGLLFAEQAALTAIKIWPLSNSFDQYSTFTLIGVSCDA
jgi:hypothetical protein